MNAWDIQKAVMEYVKGHDTDYALLITGPWGCGKTYFWNNIIMPQLRQDANSRCLQKVFYATFYGVADVKEIDRTLFAQSYPGINRKKTKTVSRIVGSIFEALGLVDLIKIDLHSLIRLNGSVVCFDDLERSVMPMKEALGYINSFVEHEGAKVIVLCNEDNIDNDDDMRTYNVMKEKLIGMSFDFPPDYKTVIGSLISDYRKNTKYHSFLSRNDGIIYDLFVKSETNNLRSLRRFLSSLEKIHDALLVSGITPDVIDKKLINAAATISFELYGRSASYHILRKIHTSNNIPILGIALSARGGNIKRTEEEIYEDEYGARYFKDIQFDQWKNVVGSIPILDYLKKGVLDTQALLEWAHKQIIEPDIKEERISRLYCYYALEDNELQPLIEDILNDAEEGNITNIRHYVDIYAYCELFIDQGIIGYTKRVVLDRLIMGIAKANKACVLVPEIKLLLEDYISRRSNGSSAEEWNVMREEILEANDYAMNTEIRNCTDMWVDKYKSDIKGFMHALVDDNNEAGLLHEPIIHRIGGDKIAEWIIKLPNYDKALYQSVIRKRYMENTLTNMICEELPALKTLSATLKKHVAETKIIALSIYRINCIIDNVDEAIKHLEKPSTT